MYRNLFMKEEAWSLEREAWGQMQVLHPLSARHFPEGSGMVGRDSRRVSLSLAEWGPSR